MKTIEQIAGDYAHKIDEETKSSLHPKTASFQGFLDGAAFAEEWIKVEDELPNSSPYIGKDRWGAIGIFKITTKSFINALDIVEWRPINRS